MLALRVHAPSPSSKLSGIVTSVSPNLTEVAGSATLGALSAAIASVAGKLQKDETSPVVPAIVGAGVSAMLLGTSPRFLLEGAVAGAGAALAKKTALGKKNPIPAALAVGAASGALFSTL